MQRGGIQVQEQVSLSSLEALYQEIKRLTPAVQRDHRLQGPDVDSVTVRSPVCGSELTLDAVICNDHVQQLGWQVRACALGQAATAIIVARRQELETTTVATISGQLWAILKGDGQVCDWPELEVFAGAREIASRHESAMLPLRALEKLFQRAQNRDRVM